MQTLIHVEVNVPRDLAPFDYGPEGYGAECRDAKLDDVVHYVVESHVDGMNPADDCQGPPAAMCRTAANDMKNRGKRQDHAQSLFCVAVRRPPIRACFSAVPS